MAERVLRARFEGDVSGLKRMAAEGRQEIASVADAQAQASRAMVAATEQGENKMAATVQIGTQRRIASIQREVNEAIQAIEKLPLAREEKERQIARIVETNAKRTSEILIQEIRKQEQAHQHVSDGMGSQSEAAIALTRNIAGLVAAYVSLQSIMGMAGKGLSGNADLQQAGLTFEVLFKDADRAKAKIEELYSFSAKTPFEFAPVKDAALALETFGLNSSVYLRDAGDLAAAFGAEISEVARVFGRINSGDFGEAFERLRDFGISRELLEGEGLVFDKSGSYQGSVDQALTAVQNIIRTKFGGMMERQSGIFNGQMSNLADNFQTILNSVMAPTFENLTGAVTELNTALDGAFGDEMQANIRVLGDIVNGVATASLALGKAIGETLDEMMAPLRWLRDTAASLGRGAGERDVAKSLVLSSGINPNRAQHYANLVGRGENLQNIARDFRVNSWGDQKGVQEDLGRLAVIMADAKQIVAGTKQYQNFEPLGPQLPPGGVNPRTTKTSTTSKPLEGHQLLAAQYKAGFLSDDQYLAKLNVELGKVVKNSSDYFSILEKIKALETGAPSFALPDKTRDGQYLFPGGGPDRYFGPGYGKDLVAFEDRQAKEAEKAKELLDKWNSESQKGVEGHKKWLNGLDLKLKEDSEKALRSGLEAGVSAFLDGGIGNLGEATYSLSKDAFSKALVDGIMNGDLKDAFGGLGAVLGGALQHPITAALAAVAFGIVQIKEAFDEIDRHSQKLEDQRKRYLTGVGPDEELRSLMRERKGYQNAVDNPAPGWLLWGGGHNDAVRSKLATYNSFLPDAAKSVFNSGFDESKALNLKSLDEALAYTYTQVLKFADANELSVDITNSLLDAKSKETKAAWDAALAAKGFADSMSAYGGLMKSFDWQERLGGGPMDSTDLRYAGIAATGGRLDIGNIDREEAIRLAELYGLMQYGGSEGAPQYSVGMTKPKTTREQIVEIIGYDPGKDSEGRDQILALLDQMILPMLAKMQDLTGGGQTQSIGSLSNPDSALQVDAPVSKINNFNTQVVVNTYAFSGDKGSLNDLARLLVPEIKSLWD